MTSNRIRTFGFLVLFFSLLVGPVTSFAASGELSKLSKAQVQKIKQKAAKILGGSPDKIKVTTQAKGGTVKCKGGGQSCSCTGPGAICVSNSGGCTCDTSSSKNIMGRGSELQMETSTGR